MVVDHLIEIVFKEISINKIAVLLNDLTFNGAKVTWQYCTCYSHNIDWNNQKYIEKIFNENKDFGLFFRGTKIMAKTIKIERDDLWPIVNVLNEICHGVYIYNLKDEVGYNYESIYSLLKKISNNEPCDDKKIEINDNEMKIIESCVEKILKEIEDWEFQTRIGVFINDIKAIVGRLKAEFASQ